MYGTDNRVFTTTDDVQVNVSEGLFLSVTVLNFEDDTVTPFRLYFSLSKKYTKTITHLSLMIVNPEGTIASLNSL